MRRLAYYIVIFVCLGICANAPAFGQAATDDAPPAVVDIASHVAEAAQRFGIPEHWIYAVMRAESAGRIGAVSSAGAMGLMQLMPGTWARQRIRFNLGNDPFDPRNNIMAGTSYLREMYDSYGAPGFLAAYNAGPGRYQDWRDRGRPLPAETRSYVAKIAPMLQAGSEPIAVTGAQPLRADHIYWIHSQLFAVRSAAAASISGDLAATEPPPSRSAPPASSGRPNGLFVPVSGDRQ